MQNETNKSSLNTKPSDSSSSEAKTEQKPVGVFIPKFKRKRLEEEEKAQSQKLSRPRLDLT